jgi:hypothetical protein
MVPLSRAVINVAVVVNVGVLAMTVMVLGLIVLS